MPLRKKVSAASFYAYRMMVREDEFNNILLYRTLTNQFFVDMYSKIETERLNYLRSNQELRAENYIHLKDAFQKQDADLNQLG